MQFLINQCITVEIKEKNQEKDVLVTDQSIIRRNRSDLMWFVMMSKHKDEFINMVHLAFEFKLSDA